MTLWAFIFPGILLFMTAVMAHIRHTSYWLAVRFAFVLSAAWLTPYFVGLRIVFFDKTPFDWTEPLRFALIVVIGGLAGAVLAMLIGLAFVADRRIAERTDADNETA